MPAPDALRGSIPPLVTPFRDGAVDHDAYRRLIAYQLDQDSSGILVNGTTAEPASLTVDERNDLVDVAIEAVGGRIPVVAATGSQSLAETVALTQHAALAGADALLVVTPYYQRPPQRGLVEYFLRATEGVDVPWLLYHIPGRAAVGVTVETLVELQERSPTFVGMKHAVNDLGLVSRALGALGSDFRIFVGLEELSFPMMAVGACGLMNAVGNLRPDMLVRMCAAVEKGELDTARELHDQLFEVNQAVFFETNPIPMKYMMRRVGLLERNEHRLPMVPPESELADRLDAVLDRAGLL